MAESITEVSIYFKIEKKEMSGKNNLFFKSESTFFYSCLIGYMSHFCMHAQI